MNQSLEPKGHIYEQLNIIVPLQMLQLHIHLEMIIFFKQLAKGKQQIGPSSRSDLSKYLDTDYCSYLLPNEIKHFDILKSHESTFLMLSKMTRDLLTLPMSTVASESTFSVATNILEERRTRLSDEMLEVLTCLKDLEDARFRLQKEEDEYARTLEKLDKMDFNSNKF